MERFDERRPRAIAMMHELRMPPRMCAVVTGASGFIGRHLVSALYAAGAEVRVLRRSQSRALVAETATSDVRAWEVDLTNAREVAASTIWDDATHVFHLAGLTRAARASEFIHANVTPTANIAAALAARTHPPKMLLVSSQAAAGPTPVGVVARTDDMVAAPIEAYGRSKLAGEEAAWAWRSTVPLTVLRPCAVYGEGDRDFLAIFAQVQRSTAWFATSPEHPLSLIYVGDLVECLLHVAVHPEARSQRWLVAHDVAATWRALYREMADVSGTAPRYRSVPGAVLRVGAAIGDIAGAVSGRTPLLSSQKLALAEARSWVCTSDALTRVTGWRARTPLLDGLRRTRAWYVAEGWLRAPSYTHYPR